MNLSQLPRRTSAEVEAVDDLRAHDPIARRLRELGFVPGEPVEIVAAAPFGGDPLLAELRPVMPMGHQEPGGFGVLAFFLMLVAIFVLGGGRGGRGGGRRALLLGALLGGMGRGGGFGGGGFGGGGFGGGGGGFGGGGASGGW